MSFKRTFFQRSPEAAEATATETTPVKDWGYRSGEEVVVEEVQEEEIPEQTAPPPAEIKPPDVTPPTPTPPAEVKPPEIKQVDWKAALKTADKWEALKELGYDDFTIGMLRYKEKTGDVIPYLQVKTVDYSKMSPEQLLKIDLQRQHPGISEKTLNFKFNKEFAEKYFLDRDVYPDESDEAEVGKELLQLDAETLRKKLIEEQAQFKAPEPKPDTSAAEKESLQKQRQITQKAVIYNSPVTKALQTTNAITFGEGDERFNFPVSDVQGIIDNALQTLVSSDVTEFNETEIANFYKLLAIGKDVNAFEKSLAEHYKKIGKKAIQNELGNVTPLVSTASTTEENLTPAQQLARNGRLT